MRWLACVWVCLCLCLGCKSAPKTKADGPSSISIEAQFVLAKRALERSFLAMRQEFLAQRIVRPRYEVQPRFASVPQQPIPKELHEELRGLLQPMIPQKASYGSTRVALPNTLPKMPAAWRFRWVYGVGHFGRTVYLLDLVKPKGSSDIALEQMFMEIGPMRRLRQCWRRGKVTPSLVLPLVRRCVGLRAAQFRTFPKRVLRRMHKRRFPKMYQRLAILHEKLPKNSKLRTSSYRRGETIHFSSYTVSSLRKEASLRLIDATSGTPVFFFGGRPERETPGNDVVDRTNRLRLFFCHRALLQFATTQPGTAMGALSGLKSQLLRWQKEHESLHKAHREHIPKAPRERDLKLQRSLLRLLSKGASKIKALSKRCH